MKKYKLIIPLIFSIPFSSIAISCKYEDYEKLEKDEQDDIKTNKLDFNPISNEGKNIKKIYDNELTKLFIETKKNYSNYRVIWNNLIRNVAILKNKLKRLAFEQKINSDKKAINYFINKWFPNSENLSKSNPLGKYLYKYELIYQDVDAVLADVNLVLESKEFIKYLKIIDDRLNGKDIRLETLQSALISIWKFINQHIFNPNKLTKNLDNVNLEDDKNSHNHSHAIINLIHELGLWHTELIKNKDTNIEAFKNEFNQMKDHIIDNVDHIEWETNFNNIIKTFEKSKDSEKKYDLTKQEFKDKGKTLLNKIKSILEKIRNDNGIKPSDLNFE